MLSINTTRRAAQVAVAATALTVMGTGVALACHTQPAKPADHKVGICHATGSETNPYVFIQVDEHAEKAHSDHQDGRDIVGVKSAADCPKPESKPAHKQTPAPKVTPSPAPEGQGQVLSAVTLPTTLPDTGASFDASTILALSAMTGAGAAYLKTRKR